MQAMLGGKSTAGKYVDGSGCKSGAIRKRAG